MSKAQHSGKQGPLKATIPFSGVVKSGSPHAPPVSAPRLSWKTSGASPDHVSGQRSPGASCHKGREKVSGGAALKTMRRTASLDTVYLKGQWPKDRLHWSHLGPLEDCEWCDRAKGRGLQEHSPQTASCLLGLRSSVEGLNQEIERLVLRTGADARLPTPEGHRAPLAEMLQSRSADTQTPQDFGNDSSSGSSPDTETKLGTSPRINRFLAREPPDGCEKVGSGTAHPSPLASCCNQVRLKALDERTDLLLDSAPQPSSFKLRPSLGSAFQILSPRMDQTMCQRRTSE
ncbi:hypothetical protein HUJ05_011247 [Dendroctonus ponderosae]|nr:hypothetical protein HUJ05_011247 [Dendroctonus ponderosae]